MKGLLLSLAVFVLYFISTVVLSHVFRFQRHSKLFLPAAALWTPVYFALYYFTSPSLGILSPPWMATYAWVDVIYGYAALLLNIHSYMDFFFGFNGGFSTSMMVKLMRAGPEGMTTEEMIACYRLPDGTDKIFAWRLPRLVETGYIVLEPISGRCRLTPKGRVVARLGALCKNILSLGKGG